MLIGLLFVDRTVKFWVIAQECITIFVLGIANIQDKIFDDELYIKEKKEKEQEQKSVEVRRHM